MFDVLHQARRFGLVFLVGAAVCTRCGIALGQDSAVARPESESTDSVSAQMRKLAEVTDVTATANGQQRNAVFLKQPVFRYSDQPRRIQDATLWAWTLNGRPIAMQKVESVRHVNGTMRPWTVCFASLCEDLIAVDFVGERTYQSRKPGIEYSRVPDAPPASPVARIRRRQMKQLAARFSATITQEPTKPVLEEMRQLTRPIMEYSTDDEQLPIGSVFGFTSGGTNPDAFLVIEARMTPDGTTWWHYGAARMTTGGVELRLDGTPVWTVPWIRPIPKSFDRWTYFFVPREI